MKYMNIKFNFKSVFTAVAILLTLLSFFAKPAPVKAGFLDDLLGLNNNSYSSYNPTNAQNNGDIKVYKQVRNLTSNSWSHSSISVRSGSLLEVEIEVKNTSTKYSANVVIHDQIFGNMIYVKDSLRVNGQPSAVGLTTNGLVINMPNKSRVIITYQIYACGSSGSAMQASAYAPGVGAGNDAIVVTTDTLYSNQYDNTSVCISQLSGQGTSNSGNYGSSSLNSSNSNPFGEWTGVNNANLGLSSQSSVTTSVNQNSFGTWTGVGNSNSGLGNSNQSGSVSNPNPFGTWTGVNNTDSVAQSSNSSSSSNNSFGDWTGVDNSNSTTSTNPFGTWEGVDSSYNASTNSDYGTTTVAYGQSSNSQTGTTYYVAPTTGVNTTAPYIFAGLFTAGFLMFKKRKLIFN